MASAAAAACPDSSFTAPLVDGAALANFDKPLRSVTPASDASMPALVSRPMATPRSSTDTPKILATGAAYLNAIPMPSTLAADAFAPVTKASTTREASLACKPNPFRLAETTEPMFANPVPVASAPRTIAFKLALA